MKLPLASAQPSPLVAPALMNTGRGDVLHDFAPIAAVQLGPAFSRGTDKSDREALVVRHSDDGGLAPTRMALQTDAPGVHRFVGLEIIQGAPGAPRPGTQDTPVVQLAGLTLVDQADDSLVQTGAVIGLNAAGVEDG